MSTTTGDAVSTAGGDDFEGECSVRVYVRIRPLNRKELAEKQVIEWQYNKTAILEATQNGQRQYAYDACFGVESTNKETYELVGKPVVIKAMEGFNGTVFTYGQTGSGKTWTMRGNSSDPGMMILCLDDIFSFIESHTEKKYELKVSYMEVYNEDINDLLYKLPPNLTKEEREKEEEKHKNLRIATEDASRGAVVENLTEVSIGTKTEAFAVLERGESNRSYAATSMNDTSSRSHVIYRIAITIFDKDLAANDNHEADNESILYFRKEEEELGRVSYMNLVDLAGSERQKSTNATGKTLKEGANINKSLLALGAVINKLVEASKKPRGQKSAVFIPYRDSKLTRILKQSLGGNTLTSILCTISPAPMFRDETVSTLKFGQLCKLIKNQVQSNVIHDDKAEMRRLRNIISEQKGKIEELESRGGGGVDNRAELTRAFRDKKRLEAMVEALGVALKDRGGDPVSVENSCLETQEESLPDQDFTSGGVNGELLNEFRHKIKRLESKMSAYKELENEKEDLERSKETHEKDKEKLELDMKRLADSREEYQKIIGLCDDKEAKANKVLAKLNDMQSNLQKKLNELKDLEDRWKGQAADLTKKEDLVKEWEKSHAQRERQLEKDLEQLKSKSSEHSVRLAELVKEEQKHKAMAKELEDRKLKLEVTLSKIGQKEDERVSAEERLLVLESELKRREADISFREREIHSKKREHESWDTLLMEKERSISTKQREVDDKESKAQEKEEKINLAKLQFDKKLQELRQSEQSMYEKTEDVSIRMKELQIQELAFNSKMEQLSETEKVLSGREENLKDREKQLVQLQTRMSGIEHREKELSDRVEGQKKIEDRHHNEIGQISARHRRELSEIETLVEKQSKIIENFKLDLERSRADLVAKTAKIHELENFLLQQKAKEEQLRAELLEKSSGIGLSGNIARSTDDNTFDPRTPSVKSMVGNGDSDDEDFESSRVGKSPSHTQTSKDLMRRLADSQRTLFHILETNMASPQNDPVFQRSGPANLRYNSSWQPTSLSANFTESSASGSNWFPTTESSHPSTLNEESNTRTSTAGKPFSPPRSGSDRHTFDIDSPEMREFISRGRKPDGLPVTNLEIRFGMAEKRLVETSKKAAATSYNMS